MPKKKVKAPEGAPEWLVTYGDMMTLLLCFFVLLFAFSVENAKKFEQVRGSLQAALNQGIPVIATPVMPGIQTDDEVISEIEKKTVIAGPEERRMGAFNVHTQKVRDGVVITIGGKAVYEKGKADLSPEIKFVLDELMGILKTTSRIVEIRGHTSGPEDDRAIGDQWKDKWELAWTRAFNVAEYMIGKGQKRWRFRVSAAANYEPIKPNIFETGEMANRRLEIILKRAEVGDFPRPVEDLIAEN